MPGWMASPPNLFLIKEEGLAQKVAVGREAERLTAKALDDARSVRESIQSTISDWQKIGPDIKQIRKDLAEIKESLVALQQQKLEKRRGIFGG